MNKNLLLVKEFYNKNYYEGIKELIEIKINWNFIIYHELKFHTKPIKIFFMKNFIINGILYVEVQKSVFLEFEMNKKIFLNNINLYFNKDILEKIITIPSI